MGNTIFARDEPSKVNKGELEMLYAIAYDRPFDLGYELARKMEGVAESTSGVICIGGMITPLAHHFGVDLERYTPIVTERKIEEKHLLTGHTLKKE